MYARRRAALGLVLIAIAASAFAGFQLLTGGDPPSYSPVNLDDDPWAYSPDREDDFEARAAAGLARVYARLGRYGDMAAQLKLAASIAK